MKQAPKAQPRTPSKTTKAHGKVTRASKNLQPKTSPTPAATPSPAESK
jgi:hypothetical protein